MKFLKNTIGIKRLFFLFMGMLLGSCQLDSLSVLSYNIRYASPNDGPNLWNHRKGDMIQTLSSLQPDLLGLQEVVHSQLMDLVTEMKDYSYIGVGREDGKTKGEYSPILFRKDRLKLLESNTFWLSETPNQASVGWDAALERICTYGRFQHLNSRQEFWIFNTHFDHIGTTARANAAQLILDQIERLNSSKLPVVITGDFNLEPHEEPIQIMQSAFTDVQQDLSEEAPNFGTFTGFDIETVGDRRIDYIFQKGFTLIGKDHLWLKTKTNLWLSDHHPVNAFLEFKN
ncbi:endonuclease/exonuclease/phosphatase family protein [Flavobacteriaceae bacterium]|nr:endonuclease/exonuclease/phosphatase family protein [Flavobacteriaceae bacterium]MDC3354159.1 endonuclease/exonuclease/phosphatase family protein [Flavobacteriaceae bacterium]